MLSLKTTYISKSEQRKVYEIEIKEGVGRLRE